MRIFSLFILLWAVSAHATPATQLQNLLAGIKSMRANFTQTIYSENKTILQSASGEMQYKKPNLFYWQVVTPEKMFLIADGKKFWNYDVNLEQVTVQNYTGLEELTPLSFLLEDLQQLPKNFSIANTSRNCFLLMPNQHNNNFVNINVCFNGAHIAKLQVLDHLSQTSVFEFSQVQNNVAVANNKFNFSPPPGVDVIGAR